MYYFEILKILGENKERKLTSFEIFSIMRENNPQTNKLRTQVVLQKMFLHNKNVFREEVKRHDGREFVYFLKN